MSEETRMLQAIECGEAHTSAELLPMLYEELRRLAAHKLSQERPSQTLQATALVHEAWLRIEGARDGEWDGRRHFLAAAAQAMRRILVENARRKQRLKHGGGFQRVEVDTVDLASPLDGLLAGGNKLVTRSGDNLCHEWNLTTGLEMQSWQPPASLCPIGVSPDERLFVAIGMGGDVVCRDLADESNLKVDLGVLEAVDACFSPDGELFAAASAMGYARVWKTATWREVATLCGHLLGVHSAAFSGDGKRLATGGGNAALKLWDTGSWQDVLTLEGQGSQFGSLAFSPDGDAILAVNHARLVHIWRAPSWAEINAAENPAPAPGP